MLKSTPRTERRAFTLAELAVSMALIGIVVSVASTLIVSINKAVTIYQAKIAADEEAKLLSEWLVFQLRGIGGDEIRPWEGITVNSGADSTACAARGDLPACDGSDRLIVTFVDSSLGSCGLTGNNGVNFNVRLEDAPPLGNGNGLLDKNDDACCLMVVNGAVVSTSLWEDRNAIALDKNRAAFPVKLHNKTSAGGDGCSINVPGGFPAGLLNENIPGGTLILGQQTLYFRAPADDNTRGLKKNTLYEFKDLDFDNLFDAGELRVIADNVSDLQIALGYDADADGRVVETSSTTDEWHLNATGDVPAPTVPADTLRMLAVGVIVSVPLPPGATSTSARVFDGPLRTGTNAHLRATITRAFLRNIFVFD